MLTVLNLAIGITFVYLLFSFVVSALNEFWLTYLDKRADFLKQGLQQLLQDPEKVKQVLDHGLVDALYPAQPMALRRILVSSLSRLLYWTRSSRLTLVPSARFPIFKQVSLLYRPANSSRV
jgi:hypothetical protein